MNGILGNPQPIKRNTVFRSKRRRLCLTPPGPRRRGPRHFPDEKRLVLLGSSREEHPLVVMFVDRGETIRIISARQGTPRRDADLPRRHPERHGLLPQRRRPAGQRDDDRPDAFRRQGDGAGGDYPWDGEHRSDFCVDPVGAGGRTSAQSRAVHVKPAANLPGDAHVQQ